MWNDNDWELNRFNLTEAEKNNIKLVKQTKNIEFLKEKYYTRLEYKKEWYDSMSFVGFVKCSNGILAFGDTKGTIDDFSCDTRERNIKKVFQNDSIMLVTYGNNEVRYASDDVEFLYLVSEYKRDKYVLQTVYLENILEDFIVKQKMDLFSFELSFQKLLFKAHEENTYNFIAYNKKTNTFHEFKINTKEVIYNSDFCYERGSTYYVNCMEELYRNNNFSKITVNEAKRLFNKTFTKLVKLLDKTPFYNPVGLPFTFEKYIFRN